MNWEIFGVMWIAIGALFALLGLVGLGAVIGDNITYKNWSPWWMVAYLTGILLVVTTIIAFVAEPGVPG